MDRAEHLQWAKDRALEYVDTGQLQNAFASFASDLNKHDALRNHYGIELGMGLLLVGQLNTAQKMRDFINDFN